MAANEDGTPVEAGRKKINPELFWLGAILLLAIAIRTIAVLSRDMIQLDEASYARMAENLLEGRAPFEITGTSATELSILYPFVTAAFAVVTRDAVSAGYAVSVLFSSLLILPTYMFGKVMWNNRVGAAAAALVAVLPLLVDAGSSIDGQNMYAFWLLCALFFGYRMQFTKRCMCGMLSGTCLGLAFLSDPAAIFYLAVLLPLLVIIGLRQEVAGYANKAAAHFMLMFLLFSIPGIVYITWQTGSFMLSDRSVVEVYASVNQLQPGSPESEQELMGLDSNGEIRLVTVEEADGYFASLINDPGPVLEATARSAYRDYLRGVHSLVPVWLLPLIGLGMFKTVWTRREALKYGYFALVMLPLLVLPVIWSGPRYILPYLGIAMLLVAKGWKNLEEWSIGTVNEIRGGQLLSAPLERNIRTILTMLVLLPLVLLSFWNIFRADYQTQFRQAGEWLESRGEEDVLVMSREASTAYYSGGDLVVMPYASRDEIVDYGRRNGADYLVVSRTLVDELRPQLKGLMDPDSAGGDLEAVYQVNQGTEDEIIVFRLR